MTEIHICSGDAFLVDAIEVEMTCLICLRLAVILIGWTHDKCTACNSQLSHEPFMGDIARKRRKLLRITRRQIADELQIKTKTVRTYETSHCSQTYFDALGKMVRENDADR